MTSLTAPWRDRLRIALVLAPLLSLVLNALAWLRYGLDLPFFDDFRVFDFGRAGSLAPRDLFTSSNDTLSPVGLAIDAIVQRALGGHAVIYQLLSMLGLLGGLLLLQWRLISSVVSDRAIAAAAFSLCLFMIQPGTYWGLQNLAYHQGLPTLFLMAALTLSLEQAWSARWGAPVVTLLGLLAGFSYISGAFAGLTVAIVLMALGMTTPKDRALLQSGGALLAAAVVAVAAQGWVILSVQQGRIHDPNAAWALPGDLDFWMFLLGKIGRALAIPDRSSGVVLFVVAVIAVTMLALAAILGLRLLKGRITVPAERRAAIVVVALTAMVFGYLALLSAGRANLRPPMVDAALEVFAFGFRNYYHFFWVTLLVPWTALAALLVVKNRWPAVESKAPVIAAGVVLLAIAGGAMSHVRYYRGLSEWRVDTQVHCLVPALAQNGPIMCPRLYPGDLRPALAEARRLQASFLRAFNLAPIPLGSDNPPPLFRLSTAPSASIGYENSPPPRATPDGYVFAPADNGHMILTLPAADMARCRDLEVTAAMRVAAEDEAEVFVTSPQGNFGKEAAASMLLVGNADSFAAVAISVQRPRGFGDRLRFDPVRTAQDVVLKDLEVRCRFPIP